MDSPKTLLDAGTIKAAFKKLSDRLVASGTRGEICLVGGAALVLAFNAREATLDVDAIISPAADVLHEAVEMSDDSLPYGWLSDAARVLTPKDGELYKKNLFLEYPNLSVYTPPAEYLLAMKVKRSRLAVGKDFGDVGDIRFLLKHMGVTDPEDAWNRVSKYYPPEKFAPHAKILLAELCKEFELQKKYESPEIT